MSQKEQLPKLLESHFQRIDSATAMTSMRAEAAIRFPRVLHLVETLEVGGTETQAVQTALRQHSASQRVTVACLRAQGPLLEPLQSAGISVIEFRKDKRLFSIRGVRQLLRLALFLRRRHFDVLHCHDLMSNLLGVPAARLAGTPVVISSRRYVDLDWWSGNLRNRIAACMYSLSTYVVVNASSISDLLVNRDGVRRDKIRVLYNGIDIERFRIEIKLPLAQDDEFRVAVVANMYSRVKGHTTLIAAAKEVCRQFPNVVFVLIGDGKERPKLEQEVRHAGLGSNFLFLGSRTDVSELLSHCHISVLPSESEGFPNAVLEAMAARLPVVATAVGGVPEVVETEVTGLLVPARDPHALALAISRLVNDKELRCRLADAGHNRVAERFSFPHLIGSLEAMYKEPLKQFSDMSRRQPRLQALAANASFANQVDE